MTGIIRGVMCVTRVGLSVCVCAAVSLCPTGIEMLRSPLWMTYVTLS